MAMQLIDIQPFPQIRARQQIRTGFLRKLYGRSTNNETVFRYMNRDFIRAKHEVKAPALSLAGARVAHDMAANGLAFADFSEFFPSDFLTSIRDAFDNYRNEFNKTQASQALKGKAVFLDTIHKAHTFLPNDPVSAYLSEPAFAAISAEYMKMVPRFVGSSFWHTKPAPSDGRIFSQLWHRDYNDRRLVKVFLYLNDVGPDNGFFEYLTGSQISGRYGEEFDAIGDDGLRSYPDEQKLDAFLGQTPVIQLSQVPPEKRSGETAPWSKSPTIVQCHAPAGTLIFSDTFGLHRGGHVKQNHRDMIMLTYSTNFNVHKPHFSVTREFGEALSPFMKKAFGIG